MVGCDLSELLIRRIRVNSEESARLSRPAVEVGAEHRRLLVVRHLCGRERLNPTANPQPALGRGAQVPYTVRLPSGRHKVPLAPQDEQVNRDAAPLAAGSATDLEYPLATKVQPQAPNQEAHDRVEHVHHEPRWLPISSHQLVFSVWCAFIDGSSLVALPGTGSSIRLRSGYREACAADPSAP